MKYGNRKIEKNGITFDSLKEYYRYCELTLLEKAGEISELKTQVRFEILPSQKRDGKVVERAVHYVADFTYVENGKLIVEDTKGFRTRDYIIKKKLMLFLHKIQILET